MPIVLIVEQMFADFHLSMTYGNLEETRVGPHLIDYSGLVNHRQELLDFHILPRQGQLVLHTHHSADRLHRNMWECTQESIAAFCISWPLVLFQTNM